ncbi:hypothetical protein [Planifilum fulgidum]|uniref:hypothetical protein n=1 Tax=Planifilum fulgidum TaxID=201973 RepID=UPI0011603613|nr:hypothetical protein [Planifilum fulgidum]
MDSLTEQVLRFLCTYKECQKNASSEFRVINADVVKAFETAGLTPKEKRLLLGLVRTQADFRKVIKRRDFVEIESACGKMARKLKKLGRNHISLEMNYPKQKRKISTGRVKMDYPKYKRKKWGIQHIW